MNIRKIVLVGAVIAGLAAAVAPAVNAGHGNAVTYTGDPNNGNTVGFEIVLAWDGTGAGCPPSPPLGWVGTVTDAFASFNGAASGKGCIENGISGTVSTGLGTATWAMGGTGHYHPYLGGGVDVHTVFGCIGPYCGPYTMTSDI